MFAQRHYTSNGTYELKATRDSLGGGVKHAVAFDQMGDRVFTSDLVSQRICFVRNSTLHQCPFILPLSSQIYSISYDWVAENIYWADNALKVIGVFGMRGKVWRTLVNNLEGPKSIVAVPTMGYLFWIDAGNRALIERSDMAGDMRVAIIKDNLVSPTSLFFDISVRKLFWLDTGLKMLCSCGVDGSSREVYNNERYQGRFNSFVISWPYAIFGTEKNLLAFQITENSEKLQYKTSITFKSYIKVKSMAISSPMLQPKMQNKCSEDNGGCAQLCFANESDRVCMCGIGYELAVDGKDCYTEFSKLPSTNSLLVLDSEGRIIRLDKSSGQQFIVPFIPNIVDHISYNPQEQMLFYSSESLIYSLDFKTYFSKRIYSSSILNTITGLTFEERERKLYFTTMRGDVSSMDLRGNHLKNLFTFNSPHISLLGADSRERALFLLDGWSRLVWRVDMTRKRQRIIILRDFVVKALTIDTKNDVLYFITNDGILYSGTDQNFTAKALYLANSSNSHFNHESKLNSVFKSSFISKLSNNINLKVNLNIPPLYFLSEYSNANHHKTNFTSIYQDVGYLYLTDISNFCIWKISKESSKAFKLNSLLLNKPIEVVEGMVENDSTAKHLKLSFIIPILLSLFNISISLK